MSDQRCSDSDESKRDIPSFIEPRPPLIANPFMRPRPQKGTNLLELFEEDSESEDPEWVQVYLRLKPCSEPTHLYEVRSERCLITSVDTATAGHGRRTQHHISKMYTFSHIFGPDSSQQDIFEHVVKDNLKKLPEGHNFTLLTYGASGSGKTYTLMGTVASPGLVPRALEYVFQVVDAAQAPLYKPAEGGAETLGPREQEHELTWVKRLRQVAAPARDKYRRMSSQLRAHRAASALDLTARARHYVWVSFVEIYNEGIYDLLSNNDRSKATSKLRIREDSSGNVYVKGALQAFVRSGLEAYDVLVRGKHALQVAATGVHARSSRSHCIFTITMLTETDEGVRVSMVRLCDLAGSERARHTRNTGARMQESRAINSSLHVLERCLHMLRRKQRQPLDATLVPYRESKLTRLLGAGLCGARGGGGGGRGAAEAVAMVVTLNPAPQYAHETRHVLQLAAVARDIQVNATVAEGESTLESTASSQEGGAAAELVRLRADNERLHYELVQAHSRIAEQRGAMEARQQQVGRTMRGIVEEAKDMTRQYYEPQIHALRAEVAQLMTDNAILEETLAAERLTLASAKEEIQHLRACLEERDAKTPDCASEVDDEDSLGDSEGEEDDSAQDSLEPTFRKEDINRSRLLRRSLIGGNADTLHIDNPIKVDDQCDNETIELDSDTDDSVVDKSGDTLKDDSLIETTRDSTYNTGESETSNKLEETYDNISNVTHNENNTKSVDVLIKDRHNSARGTYCIQNFETSNICEEDAKTKASLRGTYFVSDATVFNSFRDKRESIDGCDAERDKITPINKNLQKIVNKDTASKISNISDKSNHESDISLAQFEQLEKDTKKIESSVKTNAAFTDIQSLKDTKTFFEDNLITDTNVKVVKINNEKKIYFNDVGVASDEAFTEVSSKLNLITDRSPSIVKDNIANDFEPNKIKKLLGQSFTKQPDVNMSSQKTTASLKKHESVDIFEGFDSPNVIFKTDDKIDKTESACSLTKETILQKEKTLKTDQSNKLIDKINYIDAGFEELQEDIKVGHSVETADLVKRVNDKSVNSKENTDISTTKKSKISEDNDEINDIKTHPKLTKTKSIDLDQECGKKQIDTKLSTNQDSCAMLDEASKENQVANVNDTQEQINCKENNTIDDFDNIYKDITAPRATEFEMLLTQEISSANMNETNNEPQPKAIAQTKPQYNLRHQSNLSVERNEIEKVTEKSLEIRSEVESKPPKRNLRLRRQKNLEDDTRELNRECTKLKDIVNLQREFSDVTLDVPAAAAAGAGEPAKELASPERGAGEENLPPPPQDIHSYPSKSVTRSRRKLFTPRAEPPEESAGASGDSAERVHVPRPSYHRGRARRKL